MGKDRPILVLGGSGHYGGHIVRDLVRRQAPVRVMSRNAPAARQALGEAVEVVRGDLLDPAATDRALSGARAVVLAVSTHTWKSARLRDRVERVALLELLTRLPALDVPRVVYLSGYDVQPEFVDRLGLADFARPMLEVQAALRSSEQNWTVLGCAPSMELYFALIRGTRMIVPGGGPPALPTISPLDLGAVAAEASLRDDLAGRHIRCPGPEALAFSAAAARISRAWGQPLRVLKIPRVQISLAGALTRPFNPFLWVLACSLKLMNSFPPEIAAQVPEDHARLRETFDFTPTTLDAEAQRRRPT